MKWSLGFSNFLKESSSLSHSVVFLYFFALITEKGFLISPCYSLELCVQMLIIFPFLFCFSLLFFSQLFVRPPQTAVLLFCISFPWGSSCVGSQQEDLHPWQRSWGRRLDICKGGIEPQESPWKFSSIYPHNQSLPTLLLHALTYTSDFMGGCPPPPLSEKKLT